jgi:hypothetical protein
MLEGFDGTEQVKLVFRLYFAGEPPPHRIDLIEGEAEILALGEG